MGMVNPGGTLGDDDDSALNTAVDAATGLASRVLWAVGGILAVAGAVTAIATFSHHRGTLPYLLAGVFLLLFLCALDMWHVERRKVRNLNGTIRTLDGSIQQRDRKVERLEDSLQHVTKSRDDYQRMHAEAEAELRRTQAPHIYEGTAGIPTVAPAGATGPSGPVATGSVYPLPGWPGYEQPPPKNQPPLFDQDEGQP